jgi:hypothetical protein
MYNAYMLHTAMSSAVVWLCANTSRKVLSARCRQPDGLVPLMCACLLTHHAAVWCVVVAAGPACVRAGQAAVCLAGQAVRLDTGAAGSALQQSLQPVPAAVRCQGTAPYYFSRRLLPSCAKCRGIKGMAEPSPVLACCGAVLMAFMDGTVFPWSPAFSCTHLV